MMRRTFARTIPLIALGILITAALAQEPGRRANKPQVDPADLPAGIVIDRDVAYRDDTPRPSNLLDIAYSKEDTEGGRPVIIFVHGGGWHSGAKATFGQPALPRYAEDGYVVATINYRLSGAAKFPAQIEDVKAAIRWLRANAKKYHADPDHIGLIGGSAGAHLVALAAVTSPEDGLEGDGPNLDQSSRVQCVVARSGIYDLRYEVIGDKGNDDFALFGLLGGTAKQKPDLAKKASPAVYLDRDDPPMLIIHGTNDPRIPYRAAEYMVEQLKKAGTPYEFITIEGGGHGGAPTDEKKREVEQAIRQFFAKHLKGERPPAPAE
jgi:acetyl esterase/lipase